WHWERKPWSQDRSRMAKVWWATTEECMTSTRRGRLPCRDVKRSMCCFTCTGSAKEELRTRLRPSRSTVVAYSMASRWVHSMARFSVWITCS
ncbi:unnamed protein product, partial [Ixodes pacificus]